MAGTDYSDYVDLSLSDDEEIRAIGDFESTPALKASLKRKMSESSMEDIIDHAQLHASIERDVLCSTRFRQGWSFGSLDISKPSTQQRISTTPYSSQDSTRTTQQSSQTSIRSVFAPRKASAGTGNLESPRASSMMQTKYEDLQIQGTEPADSYSHSAKRRQQFLTPAMPLPPGNASPSFQKGQRNLDLSDHDCHDDEETLQAFIKSTAKPADVKSKAQQLPDSVQDIIDLEEDEAAQEAEEIEDEATAQFMQAAAVDENDQTVMSIIEISSDEETEPRTPRAPLTNRMQFSARNISARLDNLRLDEPLASATHGVHTYKPGDGVEFHNGTFMRIKLIYETRTGQVVLSGPFLTRREQHCLDPMDPKNTCLLPSLGRMNELVWTVTIDGQMKREKDYVERELGEAMCPREINFTNQTWPCISSQIHTGNVNRKYLTHIYKHGPLFCRWKRVKQVRNKQANQEYEDCLSRLTDMEADAKHSIKLSKLRYASRRQHVPTGGGSGTQHQHTITNDEIKTEILSVYTFADCFCGCGGASCGAEAAGLLIKWALDCDEKAARSYIANFRSTEFKQEDVSDFLRTLGELGIAAGHIVDVLHMSPPCQAFSPARTHGSEEDKEAIQAVITSVGELLKTIKPRVTTMEETSGLFNRHKDWMAHVIREMIDAGYSVRWKIMESQFWGVPQVRKRLIIVAAGPGETLPPWPKPTHGPGRKPLATIDEAIGGIRSTASHNKAISQFQDGKPKPPFSPHTQAKTITCGGLNGKENYHPSGLRPYTVRELACLQTFPVGHSFANANLTTARKQIGNAFPPKVAEAVYREIIKSLKETDGVR